MIGEIPAIDAIAPPVSLARMLSAAKSDGQLWLREVVRTPPKPAMTEIYEYDAWAAKAWPKLISSAAKQISRENPANGNAQTLMPRFSFPHVIGRLDPNGSIKKGKITR